MNVYELACLKCINTNKGERVRKDSYLEPLYGDCNVCGKTDLVFPAGLFRLEVKNMVAPQTKKQDDMMK